MDVNSVMKNIFLLTSLSFLSLFSCMSQTYAEKITVFGTQLNITADCNIEAVNKNKKLNLVSLSLTPSSNCEFIKHAETDVVHLEQITNKYMVLVESSKQKGNSCLANYTAVVIENDGDVLASKFSKTSGTCHIDRERKVFDYFYHKMKLK